MKEFKKTIDGLFICEECGRVFNNLSPLVTHIRHSHNKEYKKYYDKWIKDDNEGLCKICGKEAIFTSFQYGYRTGCCREHIIEWNKKQIKKAVPI